MNKLRLNMIVKALLLSLVVIQFACDGRESGGVQDALVISDIQLELGPLQDRFDPSRCQGPKPDDIGCTTLCKPCRTFICQDGEWVPLDIQTPEELCQPPDRPDAPDPFACPSDPDTGFCPAECSMCF